jgi:hypothetical protein
MMVFLKRLEFAKERSPRALGERSTFVHGRTSLRLRLQVVKSLTRSVSGRATDAIWLPNVWNHHARKSQSSISKPGCYYIRSCLLSPIMRIKTLLKHIKTPFYQLLHSEFLDYYIMLYHTPEISYYINHITPIISIIFIYFNEHNYIN